MGCTPSGSMRTNTQGSGANPETLDLYLRLERDIWREEKSVPAPALNHAVVRLETVGAELAVAEQRLSRFTRSGSTDDSLRDVILELGIDRNPSKAQEHEEFIANINRQALARNEVALLTRRREEIEEEVKITTAKVNYLQGLYQQQDALLGDLFGEAYGSEEEKRLELELDKLRSYRDTLAGGELEWKEAVAFVTSATEMLDRALQCWSNLEKQDSNGRFHLATEIRNCVQEAALNVQAAQALLPGVQFPFCSTRELTAVLQAVVYIFTDIQEQDKAQHSFKCYNNFAERARALVRWMDETMQHTLQKDVNDVDQKVGEATAALRAVRLGLIRSKMGDLPAQLPLNGSVLGQFGQQAAYPSTGLPTGPRRDVPPRRLTHSALFATQDPTKSQLYAPNGRQKERSKGFAPSSTDKMQKEFQRKLQSRGNVWSSRQLEQQVNYWRPGDSSQRVPQAIQPAPPRYSNY